MASSICTELANESYIYNQKLMDLLGDNNTYEQMSPQTVSNNINDFNKSYRKLISNEDKSWFSLINYHPKIPKIYSLPKAHKPDIPLRPIISGIGSAPPHNIAKLLAKLLSPLLGTISDHIHQPLRSSRIWHKVIF